MLPDPNAPAVIAASDGAATGAVGSVLIIGVIAVLLAFFTVIGIAIYRSRSREDSDEPPFRLNPPEEEN